MKLYKAFKKSLEIYLYKFVYKCKECLIKFYKHLYIFIRAFIKLYANYFHLVAQARCNVSFLSARPALPPPPPRSRRQSGVYCSRRRGALHAQHRAPRAATRGGTWPSAPNSRPATRGHLEARNSPRARRPIRDCVCVCVRACPRGGACERPCLAPTPRLAANLPRAFLSFFFPPFFVPEQQQQGHRYCTALHSSSTTVCPP